MVSYTKINIMIHNYHILEHSRRFCKDLQGSTTFFLKGRDDSGENQIIPSVSRNFHDRTFGIFY